MSVQYEILKAEKQARQNRYVAQVKSGSFPASSNRASRSGSNRRSSAPLSAPSFSY